MAKHVEKTSARHLSNAAAHRARIAGVAVLVVAAVAAALVFAAWWHLIALPQPLQDRVNLLADPNAKTGSLSVPATDVAPGSFRLVLNQVATMEAGSRQLPIGFENPQENGYAARLELSLDGNVVASTGMVEPGFALQTVQLSRALDSGEHTLNAQVLVYSGDALVNQFAADVAVRVQ